MKTVFNLAMIAALGLSLGACGSTKRVASPTTTTTPSTTPSPTTPTTPTTPVTPPPTTGTAPLSYEFTRTGNQTYVTGNITTDNVLKVRFKVTVGQGNSVHQATELKVTLAVNGTEVTPSYTTNNYAYGRVNEVSEIADLSAYITPGVPLQITVKSPMNDFYCTYVPNPFYYFDQTTYTYQAVNPQYNAYPGCRKAVFSSHNWSGVLTVQTSSTQAI
jgi:hypothetical protein